MKLSARIKKYIFEECPDVLNNTAIVGPVSPSLSMCHDVTNDITIELPFAYHVTGVTLTVGTGFVEDVDIAQLYYSATLDQDMTLYNHSWTTKVG